METAMVAVQDLNRGDKVYYADYLAIVEEIKFGTTLVYFWLRMINDGGCYVFMESEPYGRKVERVIA